MQACEKKLINKPTITTDIPILADCYSFIFITFQDAHTPQIEIAAGCVYPTSKPEQNYSHCRCERTAAAITIVGFRQSEN